LTYLYPLPHNAHIELNIVMVLANYHKRLKKSFLPRIILLKEWFLTKTQKKPTSVIWN